MSRRKTYRGQYIDFELIKNQNERTIAMGNMGVNAKGDLIKNGRIVQTSQQRTHKHNTATQESASNVSLKTSTTKESVFPEEKKTRTTKTAKRPNKRVERETDSGDIVIDEE